MQPMQFSRLATSALWFIPVAVQSVIVVVMLARGLAKRYPFFFSYTFLLPARDIALLNLPYAGRRYAIVFWWGEAAALLLALGVIVETLWHLIEPYPFLRSAFKVFWMFGILVAAAAVAILHWSQGQSGDQIIESILLFERSARFLQVCLLIVVIALISRLGMTWRSYSVGITAGFGLYAALDLTLLELRGNLHLISDSAFVLLRSAAYNLAIVIWGFYFLRPWRASPVQRLPSTDVDNWNDALTDRLNTWHQR